MFSSDFRAVIKNTSTFVKFVCLAITIGYIFSFFSESVKTLSVTPGYLIPPRFWIWTLFTFWTLEVHFLSFLADILTVLFCGKLIEPLWGSLEMWKFFAIVNTFVAILASFYSLFYAMITQNSEHLFNVHIFGLSGYIAAVGVAVRQILPDHLIVKTPLGRFTNRSVPLTALLLTIVLWACKLMNGQTPVMFGSGIVVSWIYLRFYQRHHSSHGSRGDSAENFTFASFFPNVLQPAINCFANPIYNFSLRIGLVQKFTPPRASEHNLTSVNVSFPHDIERRRQIALKALNERLSRGGSGSTSSIHDSSRQHLIPKSFPLKHHQHMIFPPAIPLPPPPSASTSGPTSPNETTNTASSSLSSSSSSAVFVDSQILIDIESETQK